MSRRARTLVILILGFGGLASWSAVFIFVKSEKLDAVLVRFTGPGSEPKDAGILGLAKGFEKPDYRVDILHGRGTYRCGTVPDTSAVDGIRFAVHGDIPLGEVLEFILFEVDFNKEQGLARARFAPPSMSSNGYTFGIESSRSFFVGLDGYVQTPVGLAVFFVVALVIVVLVLYLQRATGH